MNSWVYRWPRVAYAVAVLILPLGLVYSMGEAVIESWGEWRKLLREIADLVGAGEEPSSR